MSKTLQLLHCLLEEHQGKIVALLGRWAPKKDFFVAQWMGMDRGLLPSSMDEYRAGIIPLHMDRYT